MKGWRVLVLGLLVLGGCRGGGGQVDEEVSGGETRLVPVVTGDQVEGHWVALREAVQAVRLEGDLQRLTALGPRPPGSEGYAAALGFLEKELGAAGWVMERESFQAVTPVGPIRFTNARARWAGERAGGAVRYLLGSHLDTKRLEGLDFRGVNDSGSSTVVLLEVARALAAFPELAAGVELVFFDGEEALLTHITPRDGLYGSKHYARQMQAGHRGRPRAGLVLDLVGDGEVNWLLSHRPGGGLREVALRVVEGLKGGGDGDVRQPEVHPTRQPIVDDHQPLRVAGLPTELLIGDFTAMPYWHTPQDTLAQIQPGALVYATRFALRWLLEMELEMERP